MKKVRVKHAFGCMTDDPKNSSCQVMGELILVPARQNGTVEIKDMGMYLPYIVSHNEPILYGDSVFEDGIRKKRLKILAMPEDFSEKQLKKMSKGKFPAQNVVVKCKPLVRLPGQPKLDENTCLIDWSYLRPKLIGYSVASPLKFKKVKKGKDIGINFHHAKSKGNPPHIFDKEPNQPFNKYLQEAIDDLQTALKENSIQLGRKFMENKELSNVIDLRNLKKGEKTFMGLPVSMLAKVEHVFSENFAKPTPREEITKGAYKTVLTHYIKTGESLPDRLVKDWNELCDK